MAEVTDSLVRQLESLVRQLDTEATRFTAAASGTNIWPETTHRTSGIALGLTHARDTLTRLLQGIDGRQADTVDGSKLVVVVTVSGGVAEVAAKPAGVEVQLIDYDNDPKGAETIIPANVECKGGTSRTESVSMDIKEIVSCLRELETDYRNEVAAAETGRSVNSDVSDSLYCEGEANAFSTAASKLSVLIHRIEHDGVQVERQPDDLKLRQGEV